MRTKSQEAKEKAYPRPADRAGAHSCRSLVFQLRQAGNHVVEVAAADLAELVVTGQEQLDQDASFMGGSGSWCFCSSFLAGCSP